MAALMLLAALLFAVAAWRVTVSPLSVEGALARWLAFALVAFSFERDVLTGIAREAITNALRHGHPNAVRLRLANGEHVLRIVDDGTGFSRVHPTTGFGLIGMRERAAAAGGNVIVRSIPGLGTAVELLLATRARRR